MSSSGFSHHTRIDCQKVGLHTVISVTVEPENRMQQAPRAPRRHQNGSAQTE